MSKYEPSRLEMIITVAMGQLAGNVYKDYVEKLGLSGDECMLDFGSGSGNLAQHLAGTITDHRGKLTCVDISRRWMEVARQKLSRFSGIDFQLGEIARLPIPLASQDVVFSHFVLHDIPQEERPEVMRHLSTRLVDGGKLFVREPLRFISEEEILQLMEQNGLREESSTTSEIMTQGFV